MLAFYNVYLWLSLAFLYLLLCHFCLSIITPLTCTPGTYMFLRNIQSLRVMTRMFLSAIQYCQIHLLYSISVIQQRCSFGVCIYCRNIALTYLLINMLIYLFEFTFHPSISVYCYDFMFESDLVMCSMSG
jgi:hypothetical protein